MALSSRSTNAGTPAPEECLPELQGGQRQSVASAIRLGFVAFDRELRVESIDEPLAALHGWTIADHIGRHLTDLDPSIFALVGDALRRVLDTGEPELAVDVSGTRGGARCETRAWVYPRRSAAGDIDGVVAIVADLATIGRVDALIAAFGEVSETIASGATTEIVARTVVERLTETLAAAGAVAVIRDATDPALARVIAAHGYPPEEIDAWRTMPAGAALPVTDAAIRGQASFFERVEDAVAAYPALSAASGDARALCAVPGFSRGRPVVGLGVTFAAAHLFDERERVLIAAFAGLLGHALDIARLQEEERAARDEAESRAERVSRLQELSAGLGSAVAVADVADVVIERIRTHLGAAGCSFFVRDDVRGVVRLIRADGGIAEHAASHDGVPLDATDAVATVIRTGRPILLGSLQDRSSSEPPIGEPGTVPTWVGATAAIPLLSGDRALGALGLAFDAPRDLGPEEVAFLEAVGRLAGQALARAQDADREREITALVELAHDALILRDLDGRIRGWNRGAEETYGWTRTEAVGRRAHDLLGTRFPVSEEQTTTELRETGTWEGVVTRRRRDGGEIAIESRWSLHRQPGGDAVALEVGRDVTTRIAAEAEARLAGQRIETALAVRPMTMVTLDADLRCTWVHTPYPDWAAALLGRTPSEALPADVSERLEQIGRHVLRTGASVRAEMDQAVEGRAVTIEYTFAPLRDSGDTITGLIATGIDVSERKREERARHDMEIGVLQAQKLESLGMLAGGIAHDFNNILAGIVGYAELALIDLEPDAPTRRSVEEARDAALRAAELTRQLLAYTGKSRLARKIVDLNAVISQFFPMLAVSVARSAAIRIELAPDLPPVLGDVAQLQQVLLSLVANASEALADRPGTIVVRTEKRDVPGVADGPDARRRTDQPEMPAGPVVCLSVTDDGIGMDAGTMAQLFDPFFSTKFTGRGLGLPAALGIIRAHHGRIDVESEPGQGTTVRITLPAAVPSVATPEAGPDLPAARPRRRAAVDARRRAAVDARRRATTSSALAGRRILIADDEPAIRSMARQALERAGYLVEEAADGVACVDRVTGDGPPIDLIVLDLVMPLLDGAGVYAAIRGAGIRIPIVVISGYPPDELPERFSDGADLAFLEKPFTLDALRATVETGLASTT